MVQVSADGLLLELNLEPLQAVTAERDGAGNTGSFNGSGSARFEKSADGYWLQRIPVDWRNPQSSDAGQTFPSCSGIGPRHGRSPALPVFFGLLTSLSWNLERETSRGSKTASVATNLRVAP